MNTSIDTREKWLQNAATIIRADIFESINETIPDCHISMGFTSHGMRGKRIGECWNAAASDDNKAHIFLQPDQDSSTRLLDILAHEMIHVAYPLDGHKGNFRRVAKKIGMTGKMTSTVAGPELFKQLENVVAQIGEIPHAKLSWEKSGKKKQTTRMHKVSCVNGTGYTVRLSTKWLENYGAPLCGCCETQMERD